jgi:hypothetical protein
MKFTRLITNSIGAAVLASALFIAPAAAHARVFVSVAIAPPVIPVYAQPIAPGDGYIWTPGYWAWTDDGYQWVDGAWVLPPYVGALWTPGYWGYGPAGYFWNAGYWGPVVGYYGGINYGFGYFGTGFYGGYWGGGRFWYNRCYNHIGPYGFHNVYNRPYNGAFPHPGGSSFVNRAYADGNRRSYVGGNHFEGNNYANHGSNFGGNNNYANHVGNYSQATNNVNRSNYGGFGNNNARPVYNGDSNYNNSQHNFIQHAPHLQPRPQLQQRTSQLRPVFPRELQQPGQLQCTSVLRQQ